MDHTGCYRLNRVLTHNNDVSEKCQPYLVVTKGDSYDVRDKEDGGDVRNLGKPVELAVGGCTR
jgi:hypothetical protein